MYADVCDHFVVDNADAGAAARIEALGVTCTATDTVMTDGAKAEKLARYVTGLR
jgi:hypothetical protein